MSERDELIRYWMQNAESDRQVAGHLFEKEDFDYSLFFAHLVLEKLLKALYVKKIDLNPPFKHGLILLAQKAGLSLTEEQEFFFEEVSDFNIEARYPDVKFTFKKKCTKSFAEEYLKKTDEYSQWLKKSIQS